MSPVDILLIRGLAREAAHWGDFPAQLKKQKYVKDLICVDLPGAGRYRKLTSPLSISENAEFLLSQLEALPRKTVIVAVSLGGMVAVEMLCKRPDSFVKAYIMNSSFSNLSPFYHRLQLKSLKHFFRAARSESVLDRELAVVKMVSQKSESWEEIAQDWAQIAQERPMAVKNFFRQLAAAALYRLPERAPQTPIVVLNSQQDQMVSPQCSQDFADFWGLPLYTHPTAGHDLCVDDASWVIEKITETIDS